MRVDDGGRARNAGNVELQQGTFLVFPRPFVFADFQLLAVVAGVLVVGIFDPDILVGPDRGGRIDHDIAGWLLIEPGERHAGEKIIRATIEIKILSHARAVGEAGGAIRRSISEILREEEVQEIVGIFEIDAVVAFVISPREIKSIMQKSDHNICYLTG